MWVWILTAGVWALFMVSLAWLLRHRDGPAGSNVCATGAPVPRPPVGDNEAGNEARQWDLAMKPGHEARP